MELPIATRAVGAVPVRGRGGRRVFMLTGIALAAQAAGAIVRTDSAPEIVSTQEGWRRIHRALNDPDVGMNTGFGVEDLRHVLRNQPIRVTEGFGHGQHGAIDAANQACERHVRHCPGTYTGWITMLASSSTNVRFRNTCRAGCEVYYGLKPHASEGQLLCGLGMYLDDSLGDALQVMLISVEEPVIHSLAGPLFSEPWKW